MFEWLPQRRKSDEIVRCPYCVEGATFRTMFRHMDGEWFTCTECGHLAFPSNPLYRCTCRKCTALTLAIEDPRLSTSSGLTFRRKTKAMDSTEI